MRLSNAGETFIKTEEAAAGPNLRAYRCPANVLTIGWGHTGPDVLEGETIDLATAEMLFRRDVFAFERCVGELCPQVEQAQFDAMVSLAYNIGQGNFKKSSVCRLHNAGQYAQAGQAFMLWNKAGGKISRGLTSRRAKESAMYLSSQFAAGMDEDATGMPIVTTYVPPAEAEGEDGSSRTMKGIATAGAAVVGGPAVSSAPSMMDHLSGYQDTVLQLLPYFDAMKWALLALALAGIGYAGYARLNDRHTGRS